MNRTISIVLRIAATTGALALGSFYRLTVSGGFVSYLAWAILFELIFWGIGTMLSDLTNTMDKQARGSIANYSFPLLIFSVVYVCSICPTFHVANPLSAIVFAVLTWVISLITMRNWTNKAAA